jgi:Fe(3+) dicitrate transport protein
MDFSNQIVSQSVAGGVGTTLTSAGRTLHRGGEFALSFETREAGWTEATNVFSRVAVTWAPTVRYTSARIATAPCFDGATTGRVVATGSGLGHQLSVVLGHRGSSLRSASISARCIGQMPWPPG